MLILFVIWVFSCERVLVGSIYSSKCSGNPKLTRVGRPHKGSSHNCRLGLWEISGKRFTYIRNKIFYTSWMLFSLSTESVFKLINFLCFTKHLKILKNRNYLFPKTSVDVCFESIGRAHGGSLTTLGLVKVSWLRWSLCGERHANPCYLSPVMAKLTPFPWKGSQYLFHPLDNSFRDSN